MGYLQIQHLDKSYQGVKALDDISLSIKPGEFICFLGPSGCGKTTLLRTICGLEQQDRGSIVQNRLDISNLPSIDRDFGIVFQSYALFPNLTVRDNIAFGLVNQRRPKQEISLRTDELLELTELQKHADKYPTQLSGGQQQRVALARALAMEPGLLLLDEPLSALDAKIREHLRREICRIHHKLGLTTIMVTHDQAEAMAMADRIVVMNHGRIEQVGTPQEIYLNPASHFVADFVGISNTLNGLFSEQRLHISGWSAPLTLEEELVHGAQSVLVRPEHLCIHTSPPAQPYAAGLITEIEFLGAHLLVELQLDDLVQHPLKASLPLTRAQDLQLRPNQSAWVTVDVEHCRLLPVGVAV